MHRPGQHVAQLKIGLLSHPQDDPRTAGFSDNTARVNAVADRSPGFVWRCLDEAAAIQAEGMSLSGGNPLALRTMSVWQTPADLEAFVDRTGHGACLERRAEWFQPLDEKTYVIWPIAAGHIPSFHEGLDHLALLRANGPSDACYDFNYLRQKLPAGVTE